MKFKQALLATLLGSSLFPAITLAAKQPDGALVLQKNTESVFTPEQEARIGQVAADYLVTHPEILVQVSQKLQAQYQEQQMKGLATAAVTHHAALTQDKNTPSYGPADAKVIVVEFFDYQCVYCSHLAPIMKNVMKANSQARFVFKELPIFAGRWENSLKAAETGLQIWHQKGAEAYLHYHNNIFATGHNEGKLTSDDIQKAAASVKFNAKIAPEVKSVLENINRLVQQLKITGTPAIIVIPAEGATPENTTVIPGMSNEKQIQEAIDHAIGKQKQTG